MDYNFSNKNILIGGASEGIGWESAKLFALNGANITLMSRSEEKLQNRLNQLHQSSTQKHFALPVDFTRPDELENILKEFIRSVNINYDVVINNTGGPPGGKINQAQSIEFINAFNMHLISFHKILGVILEGMKTRENGRIINIISTSVKQPLNGLGVSNTIRGAVANWAKTLANELGEFNITVNNVLPGATNTGRLKEIIKAKAQKLNSSEKIISKNMADEVPMKRIAEPIEVANAVVFLASEKASYINGVNLPVDGGRTKSL